MTREEAIKILADLTYNLFLHTWEKQNKALHMAIEALSDRTGEWICKGDYAVCSKCGGSSGTQFDGVEPIPKTTAFCPNCGARMKGGDDE